MKNAIEHYQNKLAFEMDPSDLFAALEAGEKIIAIDARKTFAFDKERIPGAVNLPHREMDEHTTGGFDRDALYAIYCDGIGCNASTKGVLNMAKLGFNVRELTVGSNGGSLTATKPKALKRQRASRSSALAEFNSKSC